MPTKSKAAKPKKAQIKLRDMKAKKEVKGGAIVDRKSGGKG